MLIVLKIIHLPAWLSRDFYLRHRRRPAAAPPPPRAVSGRRPRAGEGTGRRGAKRAAPAKRASAKAAAAGRGAASPGSRGGPRRGRGGAERSGGRTEPRRSRPPAPPAAGAEPRPPRVTPGSRGGLSCSGRSRSPSRLLRGAGAAAPSCPAPPPAPAEARVAGGGSGRGAVLAAASYRHLPALRDPRGSGGGEGSDPHLGNGWPPPGPPKFQGRGLAGCKALRGRVSFCSASHPPESKVSVCRASAKIPDSELPKL